MLLSRPSRLEYRNLDEPKFRKNSVHMPRVVTFQINIVSDKNSFRMLRCVTCNEVYYLHLETRYKRYQEFLSSSS